MQDSCARVVSYFGKTMNLSYMQVGWIAFALNMTSSIMQPVFGMYSDKKPSPFLLPLGMFSSMLGMIGLAFAPNFIIVIISVLFIGLGSAVFHPEGARDCLYGSRDETRFSASDLSSGRKYR
ncbi:MFS transporter [Bacillus paranthracis]